MTSLERLHKQLLKTENDAIVFDGYENSIIGYAEDNGAIRVIYDAEKLLEDVAKMLEVSLDTVDGHAQATDFMGFNVLGAYVENGPLVVTWKDNPNA